METTNFHHAVTFLMQGNWLCNFSLTFELQLSVAQYFRSQGCNESLYLSSVKAAWLPKRAVHNCRSHLAAVSTLSIVLCSSLFLCDVEVAKAPSNSLIIPFRSEKPARSLLDCVTMVFRFFVSVAMLSTVLFLFSNYVEIDLTRMVNNWNEQLIMYAKRFAKKDEEGR